MNKLKDILTRSAGVFMFAFLPGAAIGSVSSIGWLVGGLVGVGTVLSPILIFFGVQLAWDASVSSQAIEKGFRAAVAKHAETNAEVKSAVEASANETLEWDDLQELDESDR